MRFWTLLVTMVLLTGRAQNEATIMKLELVSPGRVQVQTTNGVFWTNAPELDVTTDAWYGTAPAVPIAITKTQAQAQAEAGPPVPPGDSPISPRSKFAVVCPYCADGHEVRSSSVVLGGGSIGTNEWVIGYGCTRCGMSFAERRQSPQPRVRGRRIE